MVKKIAKIQLNIHDFNPFYQCNEVILWIEKWLVTECKLCCVFQPGWRPVRGESWRRRHKQPAQKIQRYVQLKTCFVRNLPGFFLDNFPHYSPTQNWRILEFWAKFLEFFVEILEFFSKSLSFFSKTLEFYNQGGLFSWNLEFYPSILSFHQFR